MFVFIIRRLIQCVIVLLTVSLLCFILFQFAGDPVVNMAGKYATIEDIERVRSSLGLDKPFYVQYIRFIGNAAQGNFGMSYVSKMPTLELILERLPATVELAMTAMCIAFIAGVFLGVLVSLKPHSVFSRSIMALSLGGISIPTFLMGILLIMVFAVWLGVLPPFGRGETVNLGFWRSGLITVEGLKHIILPAMTLAMFQLAVLLRLTRGSMREILTEEYVVTAWAKGLPPLKVIFKHALRNALIPVITIAGLQIGEMIAFSIVTETIFQWPGMGNLLVRSIFETDNPVLVTYIMLAALIILAINLVVDILYAYLNPKIRYE
ncbi:MAG: ABC transporter permease [Desulfobacteraceae bacterium]|nr:ABC transporter permease [Desulfobacteraceae bacterium]